MLLVCEDMEKNKRGEEVFADVAADDNDDNADEDDGDEVKNIIDHCKQKMYKKYKNWEEVRLAFSNRVPLSVVKIDTGEFGCVIRGGKMVELSCGDHVKEILGSHYFHWECDDQDFVHDRVIHLSDKKITNFCLMLPRLLNTGLPGPDADPAYTVVDSEWMQIQHNKEFALPKFSAIAHND